MYVIFLQKCIDFDWLNFLYWSFDKLAFFIDLRKKHQFLDQFIDLDFQVNIGLVQLTWICQTTVGLFW